MLEQINNGASFDQLAKDFSEDSGTRLNGGDQGYYKKGTLFPEFEEVAFNLKVIGIILSVIGSVVVLRAKAK